jgi:hypothetical protein
MIGTKALIMTAITVLGILWFGANANALTIPDKGFRWNQDNFFTLPQPEVVSISFGKGVMTGRLADGSMFKQYTVFANSCLRVQKFELEDYSHYVVNGFIFYRLEDFAAQMKEPCRE